MPGEAADGAESTLALRTLADKVNWLIDQAHPADRGPYTNNEVADLIEKTTGEEISYTQIWKLRNGQAQNPQMRLIEAMAKNPIIVERPIVVSGQKAALGRPPEAVLSVL